MRPKWSFAFLVAQLAAAAAIVHLYGIEGRPFLHLFLLASAGFLVNAALPLRWRLPFFVLLSLIAVFVVFDVADGAWLLGMGALLISLCHVPVPLPARMLLIAAVGAALAAARAGVLEAPWSVLVWPILGSMFMFRLVIYALAVRKEEPKGRVWAALGYFFMFPNLVFPLFPVIDYGTFRRTHYDRDEHEIHQQGLMWIARGLLHLLLYRIVYHRLLVDPVEVRTLGDVAQAMVSTFLLYLRVSGSFHLIVGLLHLFGFRLPETHKLYYLAHSFTELWRRINIYWKDFMMSSTFYPVYFRVRRRGPVLSLAVATACVFMMTWLLHSYQWFWLRGGFPVKLPDILFWGLLGAMVVFGALREMKADGALPRQAPGWSLVAGLRSFRTFVILCVLWSLWSAESVGQWLWMVGSIDRVDSKGIALIAIVFAVVVALGGRNWDSGRGRKGWWQFAQRPAVRTSATLAALFLLSHPAIQRIVPADMPDPLAGLRAKGLNQHDARLRHRGYYEELDVRGQLSAGLIEGPGGRRRENWEKLEATGIVRARPDHVAWDLHPSRRIDFHGQGVSTNRWGMRDREYELGKPPGTMRIALLGASVTMGNGVADGETFEALVEERLNRERPLGAAVEFEILNFAIDAYSLPQQVALMDERVFGFGPDVILITNYSYEPGMAERYLLRIVEQGILLPYSEPREMLQGAGLTDAARGRVPIPFDSWRLAARTLGLDPRMPFPEMLGRLNRIAPDVTRWAIRHFADQTRAHGAEPAALLLNAVHDGIDDTIANLGEMRATGMAIIDLQNVYPLTGRDALRAAPWDDHPNAAGHRLIAEKLYPELVRMLRD